MEDEAEIKQGGPPADIPKLMAVARVRRNHAEVHWGLLVIDCLDNDVELLLRCPAARSRNSQPAQWTVASAAIQVIAFHAGHCLFASTAGNIGQLHHLSVRCRNALVKAGILDD